MEFYNYGVWGAYGPWGRRRGRGFVSRPRRTSVKCKHCGGKVMVYGRRRKKIPY